MRAVVYHVAQVVQPRERASPSLQLVRHLLVHAAARKCEVQLQHDQVPEHLYDQKVAHEAAPSLHELAAGPLRAAAPRPPRAPALRHLEVYLC